MAIYAPGIRKGRHLQNAKRDVVAVLQLTAMVDMFTVLVVFLLQNYAVTDQILPVSEKIALPQATEVKALKPSYVVVLSNGNVTLNHEALGSLHGGERGDDDKWVFAPLKEKTAELLQKASEGGSSFLISQLRRLNMDEQDEDFKRKTPFRVTIQADGAAKFASIKKIMYTLTEAGVREMNFAVIKAPEQLEKQN